MFIGNRVRELRKRHRVSLSRLAEMSGVQIATLSRIEHNRMVGSLESHIMIAKALGLELPQLYEGLGQSPHTIEKSEYKPTDVMIHNAKSTHELLTTRHLNKKMMPTLLRLDGQGQSSTEEHALGSEKFAFVIEGQVEAVIGKNSFKLDKFNSLYFNGNVKHYFKNARKSQAKILCVVTPPARD